MKKERINVSRREFLIRSSTMGSGFALGLYLPLASTELMAAEGAAAKAAAAGGPMTAAPRAARAPRDDGGDRTRDELLVRPGDREPSLDVEERGHHERTQHRGRDEQDPRQPRRSQLVVQDLALHRLNRRVGLGRR